MFWWGRVNGIVAILAFGGSALTLLAGEFALFFALWIFVIALRIALNIANVLYTVITGDPLFYDTKILPGRPARRRRRDEEDVVDDE